MNIFHKITLGYFWSPNSQSPDLGNLNTGTLRTGDIENCMGTLRTEGLGTCLELVTLRTVWVL